MPFQVSSDVWYEGPSRPGPFIQIHGLPRLAGVRTPGNKTYQDRLMIIVRETYDRRHAMWFSWYTCIPYTSNFRSIYLLGSWGSTLAPWHGGGVSAFATKSFGSFSPGDTRFTLGETRKRETVSRVGETADAKAPRSRRAALGGEGWVGGQSL